MSLYPHFPLKVKKCSLQVWFESLDLDEGGLFFFFLFCMGSYIMKDIDIALAQKEMWILEEMLFVQRR